MINDRNRLLIRFLVFFAIAMVMGGLQASLWYQVFGALPEPALWLCFIVYISMYRNITEGLIITYFYSLAMANYTALPEGIFTFCNLSVFLTAYAVRLRVFSSTTLYFAALSSGSVLAFVLFELLFSWFFEKNPLVRPDILHWIPQIVFTALVAFPLHGILGAIDTLLEDDAKENWRGSP